MSNANILTAVIMIRELFFVALLLPLCAGRRRDFLRRDASSVRGHRSTVEGLVGF